MTAPRQVLPGRTYLITRRAVQRQFWLRPDKQTNQIFMYCLAAAAQRHGMRLCAWLAMSNHYHLVVCDVDGSLPPFLRHLNLMLAKALNARWGRRENLWSVEQCCATWLVDDDDALAKAVYLLVNPSAADLVECVADWPGASSWSLHLNGGAVTVERPVQFFRADGRMPERVVLRVQPPLRASDPAKSWPLADWTERLIGAVRSAEANALALRRARGARVLGRRAVRHQPASGAPRAEKVQRKLRPSLACRNDTRRTEELRALRRFRQQHRAASQRLHSGSRNVVFPAGTWAMRGLSQPGPAPAET